MALQAYPDVPLFRYPYTDLSQAQIAAALAAPARVGRESPAGAGGRGGVRVTSMPDCRPTQRRAHRAIDRRAGAVSVGSTSASADASAPAPR